MARLQVIDVSKSFDKAKALDKVSLEIPEQSIYGLLGPNGAGKTTLIRIINLISMADEGQVLLNGKPITQKDIIKIGYLPEERGLYKKMKVGEQALYLARLKGLSAADARKKLKFWFEKYEMDSWWNKKVEELSKGMQQKVQFIVTILHEPKLLIFDEPFSGFDPINVNLLKDEILNLRNQGATIIFSTHNMASVEELCDEIALLNKGKNILSGDLYDIKQRFKSHIFEVGYHASKPLLLDENHFLTLASQEQQGIRYDQIRILDGTGFSSNELLNLALPQVEVTSFREILPTLNEIFIQEVNK
jgi:ABC-2 type transport system ATP-binding protein